MRYNVFLNKNYMLPLCQIVENKVSTIIKLLTNKFLTKVLSIIIKSMNFQQVMLVTNIKSWLSRCSSVQHVAPPATIWMIFVLRLRCSLSSDSDVINRQLNPKRKCPNFHPRRYVISARKPSSHDYVSSFRSSWSCGVEHRWSDGRLADNKQ